MKLIFARTSWAVLTVLLSASAAFAQAPGAPPAPVPTPPPTTQMPFPGLAEPPLPTASLTISPIHLFLPMLEVTGEYRAAPKVGVAGIFGIGSVNVTSVNQQTVKVSLLELGGSFRYYVLGDFRHGMQVGGELLYLHASAATATDSAVAAGTAFGPFVGYKIVANVGFTFEGQLGYQRLFLSSPDSTGTDSKNIVLLNLNVGWSF